MPGTLLLQAMISGAGGNTVAHRLILDALKSDDRGANRPLGAQGSTPPWREVDRRRDAWQVGRVEDEGTIESCRRQDRIAAL
jgi:hypothetical protein